MSTIVLQSRIKLKSLATVASYLQSNNYPMPSKASIISKGLDLFAALLEQSGEGHIFSCYEEAIDYLDAIVSGGIMPSYSKNLKASVRAQSVTTQSETRHEMAQQSWKFKPINEVSDEEMRQVVTQAARSLGIEHSSANESDKLSSKSYEEVFATRHPSPAPTIPLNPFSATECSEDVAISNVTIPNASGEDNSDDDQLS